MPLVGAVGWLPLFFSRLSVSSDPLHESSHSGIQDEGALPICVSVFSRQRRLVQESSESLCLELLSWHFYIYSNWQRRSWGQGQPTLVGQGNVSSLGGWGGETEYLQDCKSLSQGICLGPSLCVRSHLTESRGRLNSIRPLFTQAMAMGPENGLLLNLAFGSGIVWGEAGCQQGCAQALTTTAALRSCCICASTCDMAKTCSPAPSPPGAVPGQFQVSELMVNQVSLSSWM